MTVAVRADASQRMGLGHLRRCLALAHALKACGSDIVFVSRELGLDSAAIVEAEGFRSIMLPAPPDVAAIGPAAPHAAWAGVSESSDAAETAAALRLDRPAWVVVDSYAFGASWHATLRDALGCRIAAVEDLADRDLAPDLLIDHNFVADHRSKYGDRLAQEISLLGGPRFALVGPAYAEADRYSFSPEVRSVGVFMGGVDLGNHSIAVVEALEAAGYEGPVEIVTTSANPNLPALREAVSRRPRTELSVDLPHLAAFFARHDLQVGAGGGASWERCCIGVPTVLLIVADNQKEVALKLAEADVVDLAPSLERGAIARTLRALLADPDRRRTLAHRSRELVDGLGARRVALRMLAETMTTRPATMEDAERILAWRNHPVTRDVSRNSAVIPREQHLAWLERTLADPARTLLIGVVGDIPVGVVRFDRHGDRGAEVSFYLDPALHGLGLGRAMLLAGEAAAARGLDIVAEVLEGNVSSARLLKSAGYRSSDGNHWIKPAAR